MGQFGVKMLIPKKMKAAAQGNEKDSRQYRISQRLWTRLFDRMKRIYTISVKLKDRT